MEVNENDLFLDETVGLLVFCHLIVFVYFYIKLYHVPIIMFSCPSWILHG